MKSDKVGWLETAMRLKDFLLNPAFLNQLPV